jgi:DNA-binding NarL/FixJ family response regulator
MTAERIQVLIADDQALVREGLRLVLRSAEDIDVVGEAADGLEAVDACARSHPDVVLMDVRMPRMDGLDATRRLMDAARPPRVLVLTTYDLDAYVYGALRAGASGFLLKDTPGDELVGAIRLIAAGDALLAPSVTRRLIEDFVAGPDPESEAAHALTELSARETEVLERLARGLSNPEIAAELIVSETTVKTHVSHILMKLGLRDRVQAVVFAYESGLVRAGRAAS